MIIAFLLEYMRKLFEKIHIESKRKYVERIKRIKPLLKKKSMIVNPTYIKKLEEERDNLSKKKSLKSLKSKSRSNLSRISSNRSFEEDKSINEFKVIDEPKRNSSNMPNIEAKNSGKEFINYISKRSNARRTSLSTRRIVDIGLSKEPRSEREIKFQNLLHFKPNSPPRPATNLRNTKRTKTVVGGRNNLPPVSSELKKTINFSRQRRNSFIAPANKNFASDLEESNSKKKKPTLIEKRESENEKSLREADPPETERGLLGKKKDPDRTPKLLRNSQVAPVSGKLKKMTSKKDFLKRITNLKNNIPEMETDGSNSNSLFKRCCSQKRLNSSLFIFPVDSTIRMKAKYLVSSIGWEVFIAMLIMLAAILLAIDGPLLKKDTSFALIMKIIDITINTLFTIEFMLKIIAFGLIFKSEAKGRKPYFRDLWNILDFSVIAISWLTYLIDGDVTYLRSFKVLRVLRLLGPLRNISKSITLNMIVETIFSATPKIVVFTTFIFFCLQIFVTLGLYNYPELFYRCELNSIPHSFLSRACSSPAEGVNEVIENSFSNYLEGLLSSVVVLTNAGFLSITRYLIIGSEARNFPIYLMILETFLSYYLLALFLQHSYACMTFFSYLEKKLDLQKTSNFNDRENKIFDMQKFLISKKLKSPKGQSQKIRGFLYLLIDSFFYDLGFFIILVANIVMLAMTNTRKDITTIKIVQMVMLILYNSEIFLKLIAFGFTGYIHDSYNVIDLFSTLICDILCLLYFTSDMNIYFMLPVLLRILTLGRFLRRFIEVEHKLSRGLKSLLDAITETAASLVPMIIIIFSIVAVFAIIGMNLFYKVKLQQEINEVYNFQDFISSFMSLLKILTGYKWNITLHEMVVDSPGCIPNQSYESLQNNGPQSCGTFTAYIFILIYILVGKYLLLNLVTVLVIDGYLESKKLDKLRNMEGQIDHVIQTWAEYDTMKSGLMTTDNFLMFLHQVDEPFGLKEKDKEMVINANRLIDKFIYREDYKVVLTLGDALKTSKKYPIPVYDFDHVYFVHYVDYISYVSNTIYPPGPPIPSFMTEVPLFHHSKLDELWNLKFENYSKAQSHRREDSFKPPYIQLDTLYVYKVTCRMMIRYAKNKRYNQTKYVRPGKDYIIDIGVKGNNQTRFKSLNYMFHNNLLHSDTHDKRGKQIYQRSTTLVGKNHPNQIDDELFEVPKKRNTGVDEPTRFSRQGNLDEIEELSSVRGNKGPLFTLDDMRRKEESSSNSENDDN